MTWMLILRGIEERVITLAEYAIDVSWLNHINNFNTHIAEEEIDHERITISTHSFRFSHISADSGYRKRL